MNPGKPEPMRRWSDDDGEQLQRHLDSLTAPPPPNRMEVLGAFPELLPLHLTYEQRERLMLAIKHNLERARREEGQA